MIAVRRAAAWGLVGALSAVSCADEGPAPTAASFGIHEACVEVAIGECTAHRLCKPTTFVVSYGDEATCVERRARLCEGTHFGLGATTSAEQLHACAQATAVPAAPSSEELDTICEAWLKREVLRELPLEASEVCSQPGTLADGAPCFAANQCADGGCLQRLLTPAAPPCGECGIPAGPNEPCSQDTDCEPPLGCASSICAPFGGKGAACGASAPCLPYFSCRAGPCGAPDTCCLPRGGPGSSCTTAADCAFWPEELTCRAGACEPYVLAVAEGDACGIADSATTPCGYGLVCQAGDDGISGSCVRVTEDTFPCILLPVGAVEPYPLGGPCREPARCVDGYCQMPDTASCGAFPP